MSDFTNIPLPEENPLNIIVDCGAVEAAPKTRGRKKAVETPAVESAE